MIKKQVTQGFFFLTIIWACSQSNQVEKKMNHLVTEKSLYLLQHADNPVNWYPWGEEAFEAALREDKPIFLSIGYSTCHWCHVMEHESFEDSTTAALMNEYFINIKVDREERPDIDNIYMAVCQRITGSGGWPLSIMMTPEKKPFFAGTYFPRERRFNRIGMLELIPQIGEMWRNDREKLENTAETIVQDLRESLVHGGTEDIGKEAMKSAFNLFLQQFDHQNGGFGRGNKFPVSHNLSFLLRYWKRTGDSRALHMVEKTLDEMRKGGIYDHIGFGFHRYATDSEWLVPHFEKMLYDQAMNAMAYLEAFQVTNNEEYAQTAREIFTYVLRDMTSPEGGFYSAEDADSEGEEGKFYLWTSDEIKLILGENLSQLFMKTYNIRETGNFREEASGRETGRNILYLKESLTELANQTKIDTARQRLYKIRKKRVHPLKDDKILTDWNGLMIVALSKGAQILGEKRYEEAAKKATDFLLKTLRTPEGHLLKRYRDGVASLPAHLEDYAFTIWGLLELYEITFEVKYLQHAVALMDIMIDIFWDNNDNGFFFTANNSKELIVRTKDIYDGPIPSGNSVAALCLLQLSRITGRHEWEQKAAMIGKVFSSNIINYPTGHTFFLSTIDFGLGPSYEIVIVGDSNSKDTQTMLELVYQHYFPNKVVIFKSTDKPSQQLYAIAPFTEAYVPINGKTTAYVCQNYVCRAPTTDPSELLKALKP